VTAEVCYRLGAGGLLGRRSGFWDGRWLWSCQRLSAVCAACRSSALALSDEIGGMGDMPVEALFPEGRERFELGSSGWSRVLGIDAVGGSPHCDFANEGTGVSSRSSPDWRAVTLADLILNLVGEVGDQLGSLCQVGSPDGMGMEC
jgi:hypothetical protein